MALAKGRDSGRRLTAASLRAQTRELERSARMIVNDPNFKVAWMISIMLALAILGNEGVADTQLDFKLIPISAHTHCGRCKITITIEPLATLVPLATHK